LTIDASAATSELLAQVTGLYGAPLVASLPEVGPHGDDASSFQDLWEQLRNATVVVFPLVAPCDLDRFFYLRLVQVLRREPPSPTLSVVVLQANATGQRLAGGFAARFRSGWPFARCIFLTERGDPARLTARIGLPVTTMINDGADGPPATSSVVCPEAGANQKIGLQLQRIWGRCGSTTGFENQIESFVEAGYLTVRVFSDAVRRRGATLDTRMPEIIAENSVYAGAHINVLAIPDGPPVPIRTKNAEVAWATWLAATATCRIRDPVVAEAARRADAAVANHLECVGPALALAPQARLLLDIRDDRARATSELMLRDGRSATDVLAAEAAAARAQALVLAIPDICGHVSVSEFERLGPQSQRSAILLPRAYADRPPEVRPAPETSNAWDAFDVLLFGDEHPFNITSVQWFLDAVWRPYLAPEAVTVAIVGRVGKHVQDRMQPSLDDWSEKPHSGSQPPEAGQSPDPRSEGQRSEARLVEARYLAPRSAPSPRILGFVDDLDAIRAACLVTVVPDRHGTGTAVKTLATLAAGHPLVTTSTGVRGLDPSVSGLLPAHDDPAALGADILTLLRDPCRLMERRRLVEAAQMAISHGPDHAALLATVQRPTPRIRAERLARWARVVAAAIPADARPYYFSLGTSFVMNGSAADRQVLLDGWHGPEHWGRWTDGATASLRVTLAGPEVDSLMLELEVMPSSAGGTLSLVINGTSLPAIKAVFGPIAWPIPADVTKGQTSFLVTLHVSDTVCPSRSGGSTDDRILGVGVSAVRLYSRGSILRTPNDYLSTRGGAAKEILLTGWHEAEDWGCWSNGHAAVLELPMAEPPKGRLLLELDIAPSPLRPMLTLSVNGHTLAPTIPMDGGNQWLLPEDATKGKSWLWVTLTVSETIRPADTDASADGRTLGIGLRGLNVIDLGSQ
jgi:hypothetical protein